MPGWLERNPFVVVALAGLLILAGLAASALMGSEPEPVLVVRDGGAPTGATIRIHVTGAVAAPGVYELLGGDRVEDALAAAGGAAPGADLTAINLARRLRDGEQILVEGPEGPAAVLLTPGEPLDLNLATQEQLIALPGIGEAYSQRIIDSRLVDGPFASVEEILDRGLVPARTFEGIRAMITVSAP